MAKRSLTSEPQAETTKRPRKRSNGFRLARTSTHLRDAPVANSSRVITLKGNRRRIRKEDRCRSTPASEAPAEEGHSSIPPDLGSNPEEPPEEWENLEFSDDLPAVASLPNVSKRKRDNTASVTALY